MKRHIIPQFELKFGQPEAFRLVQEVTTDHERIAREKRQREYERKQSEKRQNIFAV